MIDKVSGLPKGFLIIRTGIPRCYDCITMSLDHFPNTHSKSAGLLVLRSVLPVLRPILPILRLVLSAIHRLTSQKKTDLWPILPILPILRSVLPILKSLQTTPPTSPNVITPRSEDVTKQHGSNLQHHPASSSWALKDDQPSFWPPERVSHHRDRHYKVLELHHNEFGLLPNQSI